MTKPTSRFGGGAPPRRWHVNAALGAVLAAAAVLRVSAIGNGIPFALGPDEPVIVDHVVQMLKDGSLRPPFFDYPGLVFYLHLPVAGLRFLAGLVTGEWDTLAAAGAAQFYLSARVTTALFGVATVLLVYRIGLVWGARHGLLAAALLAVMPMHVRESRFALTDVPMTFFVTLALLLSVRAHANPRLSAFLWAGVAVGLGTAVKYTAGTALILPLLAACMVNGVRHAGVRAAAVGGGFVLAFAAGAPYALLDLPGFVGGIASLASAYTPRGPAEDHAAWIYAKHLLINFHWPAFALAAVGILVGAARLAASPGRFALTLVVIFPLAFVASLGNYTPIFARYVLPVLPSVCLAAAIGIGAMSSALGRLRLSHATPVAQIALAVLVLVPPARHAADYVRAANVPSTGAVVFRWFDDNVPAGAVVVIEHGALRFPGDMYRSVFVRRITDKTAKQYRELGAQYLVWKAEPESDEEPNLVPAALEDLAGDQSEVEEFVVSDPQPGPRLRILKVPDD